MKDKFVNVDQKQSREQLDSGKVDKKVFWEEVVNMFNDTTVSFEVHFTGDMHIRAAGCNPNLMYKEADVGTLQGKYKDLRRVFAIAESNYAKSGHGSADFWNFAKEKGSENPHIDVYYWFLLMESGNYADVAKICTEKIPQKFRKESKIVPDSASEWDRETDSTLTTPQETPSTATKTVARTLAGTYKFGAGPGSRKKRQRDLWDGAADDDDGATEAAFRLESEARREHALDRRRAALLNLLTTLCEKKDTMEAAGLQDLWHEQVEDARHRLKELRKQ